jgi:hypothetical protein
MLGYDPKTDTLFSGGKTFSASNLSEMDGYDKAGYFNIDNAAQLPSGFVAVPVSKVRAGMQEDAAKRGFGSAAAEFGQGLWSGLGEIPQMGVKAAAMAAPAGSWLEKSLGDAAKTYDETANTPDTFGRGEVANTLIKGAYSAAPSVATGAAMFAAPVVGTALAGSTMFGAEAWDTYERGLKEGLTPEAAKAAAYKTGAIEAVGELAGDAAGGVFLKGAGKVAMGLLKNGTVTHGKRVAVDLLANTGIQTGTEYAQGAAQTAVRNDAGFKYEDPHAVGMEGAQTGLGLSAILSPFGIAAGMANRPRDIAPAPVQPAAPEAPATPEQLQLGYGAPPLALGYTPGSSPIPMGMAPQQPIPQGYNPTSTPLTEAGQAWQGMAPSAYGPSEMLYMPGTPGAPVSAGQAGAAWQSMPQSQQTLEGGYQSLDEQRAAAGQTQANAAAEQARKEALVEQRIAAVTGRDTLAPSPSEGSPVAVAPSVTPQEPSAPVESFSREGLEKKTRSDVARAAQDLGIQVKGRMTKTMLLAAIDRKLSGQEPVAPAAPQKPVAKAPPVQPAEVAQSEEDDLAQILGDLEASVATQPAKVRGKITMAQDVLAGIARAIVGKFSRGGLPAAPTILQGKTTTPDVKRTAEHLTQMSAVRDAAHAIIDLAKQHYNRVAVDTPTESRITKRRAGESAAEYAQRQMQEANTSAAEKAGRVRAVQVRLSQAIARLVEVAGSAPNANAVIAVLKSRIHKANVPPAVAKTVDTMLSRAWKEYVDGVMDTPENVAATRSGEVRPSLEQQKRNDKMESEVPGSSETPLQNAATEGYSPRPLKQGKNETDDAFAERTIRNTRKGVLGVLAYLQRHGTLFEATLATSIAKALEAGKTMPKLEFITSGSPYYDPKKDTIYISKTASPEVALHEALHAALQWYVHSHPNHAAVKKLENALQTVLAYDRASLSPKAQEVYDVLVKLAKKSKRDAVLELISYGATLREFNVALTKMPSTDKGGFLGAVQALWMHLTALVQHMLGVRGTVANDVLDATMKLLEDATVAGKDRETGQGSKLMAAVESSTPESIAVQPGGQPSVDLTRFSKNMMPNIITEHVFKAMGWDAVPGWVTEKGAWLADKVKDKSPALSKYIGYVNANFNVPVPMREWFQRYKDEKHSSGLVTDALSNAISSLPSDQVLDILKYLDGDAKALTGNPKARELADMVKEHRAEYIAGLHSEKAKQFFRDLKFTESMIFAKSTSEVSSGALGARKLNQLAAQKNETHLNEAVYAPLDARGDLVLDGKFYRLTQTNEKGPSGEPLSAGFIHESMELTPPVGTSVERDGLVWTHTGRGAEKGSQKFTAYRNAAKAVADGQANTVANALRNTMAILAANHASNNLTSAIASKAGDADMVVFDSVKDIGKATGVTPTPGSILHLSDPEAKSGKLQGIYRSRHQWVQIPKGGVHKQADGTEVPMGTYGALQGKLVRSDIWAAVQDMTDRRPLHDIAALHTTMRVFKKAKTVYNPGTHITNIASNLTLAMMHDIPMPTVAQAARMMYQYETKPNEMKPEERRVVHAFMNSGAMLGDFSTLEIKKALYEAYKTAASTNEPAGVYAKLKGWASIELAKHETMSKWAKEAGKTDDRITNLYAAEDNAFRLAAFLSKSGEIATREGKTYLTPKEFKEAGDFARFAFLDYDIDSKAVKVLRQSVLPFVSWSYAIMPVLGHIALHKPWKLVNVLLAYSLLDMATSGDDDEEKRKEGPERFRSRMWAVGPHAYIRVPFLGDDENPVYFKLGSYIPTGNWLDKQPEGFLGINNWPQPVSPGGPFTNAILGLMGGIDPYTGKKLSTPAESDWEGLVDRAKFMGATFTPSWATLAGDMATKAAGGKGKPELGMAGNPVGNLDAARKFGGLQLDSFNTAEAKVQQNIAVKSIKADFDKEIAKLRRAEARYETPDWEAFAKRRDELLQRRNDRINEAKGED